MFLDPLHRFLWSIGVCVSTTSSCPRKIMQTKTLCWTIYWSPGGAAIIGLACISLSVHLSLYNYFFQIADERKQTSAAGGWKYWISSTNRKWSALQLPPQCPWTTFAGMTVGEKEDKCCTTTKWKLTALGCFCIFQVISTETALRMDGLSCIRRMKRPASSTSMKTLNQR